MMEQVTTRQLQMIEEITNVPEDQLQWLINNGECLLVPPGEIYFRAGDVRATAMNRVAAAVGEGSMAISFVHKYLAEVK